MSCSRKNKTNEYPLPRTYIVLQTRCLHTIEPANGPSAACEHSVPSLHYKCPQDKVRVAA